MPAEAPRLSVRSLRFRGLGFRVQGLGFPKIRDTILGFPITRTMVLWGLYWASLMQGICSILGLYMDNGKENGSYQLRFRDKVQGLK